VYDVASNTGIASAGITYHPAGQGFYDSNFRLRPSTQSGMDGTFVLNGLPPGRITLDVSARKYAARELALHGTLTLDPVVAEFPQLAERHSFQRDRAGHFRSAYSVVPSLEGAVVALLLRVTGLDLRAPLAPSLIAALTASLLTAAAVALVYSAVARSRCRGTAALVAVGLGFGTNLWPMAARSRQLGRSDWISRI